MFTLNNGSLLRTLQLSVKVKEAINPKQSYEDECRIFPEILPLNIEVPKSIQLHIDFYNKYSKLI